jgi:Bacterial cadherin-like domain
VSDGQTIYYTFDGVQMSSLSLATVETLLGGTSFASWGFTGATDTLSEQEQVRLVKMEATGEDGTAYQIVGPNKDPVAVDDAYTVDENGMFSVSAAAGVLANDYDPDGDPLRICPESRIVGHALLLAPTNGTVKMNEDGSFTYTPNAGFAGVDSSTTARRMGLPASKGGSTSRLRAAALASIRSWAPPPTMCWSARPAMIC